MKLAFSSVIDDVPHYISSEYSCYDTREKANALSDAFTIHGTHEFKEIQALHFHGSLGIQHTKILSNTCDNLRVFKMTKFTGSDDDWALVMNFLVKHLPLLNTLNLDFNGLTHRQMQELLTALLKTESVQDVLKPSISELGYLKLYVPSSFDDCGEFFLTKLNVLLSIISNATRIEVYGGVCEYHPEKMTSAKIREILHTLSIRLADRSAVDLSFEPEFHSLTDSDHQRKGASWKYVKPLVDLYAAYYSAVGRIEGLDNPSEYYDSILKPQLLQVSQYRDQVLEDTLKRDNLDEESVPILPFFNEAVQKKIMSQVIISWLDSCVSIDFGQLITPEVLPLNPHQCVEYLFNQFNEGRFPGKNPFLIDSENADLLEENIKSEISFLPFFNEAVQKKIMSQVIISWLNSCVSDFGQLITPEVLPLNPHQCVEYLFNQFNEGRFPCKNPFLIDSENADLLEENIKSEIPLTDFKDYQIYVYQVVLSDGNLEYYYGLLEAAMRKHVSITAHLAVKLKLIKDNVQKKVKPNSALCLKMLVEVISELSGEDNFFAEGGVVADLYNAIYFDLLYQFLLWQFQSFSFSPDSQEMLNALLYSSELKELKDFLSKHCASGDKESVSDKLSQMQGFLEAALFNQSVGYHVTGDSKRISISNQQVSRYFKTLPEQDYTWPQVEHDAIKDDPPVAIPNPPKQLDSKFFSGRDAADVKPSGMLVPFSESPSDSATKALPSVSTSRKRKRRRDEAAVALTAVLPVVESHDSMNHPSSPQSLSGRRESFEDFVLPAEQTLSPEGSRLPKMPRFNEVSDDDEVGRYLLLSLNRTVGGLFSVGEDNVSQSMDVKDSDNDSITHENAP